MVVQLTDAEIQSLLKEEKHFPKEWATIFQMKEKRGHKEKEITIERPDGSLFKIIVRQNSINVMDFSIILGYMAPRSNVLFRLRRYNGKSHEHTNKIEGLTFYDYHLHTATQRYQEAGFDEDGYAEPSSEYADLQAAGDCLKKDCSIILPGKSQLPMTF